MGQKKRQRAAEDVAKEVAEICQNNVQNALEQANFQKLVRTGVIVEERLDEPTCHQTVPERKRIVSKELKWPKPQQT